MPTLKVRLVGGEPLIRLPGAEPGTKFDVKKNKDGSFTLTPDGQTKEIKK